MKFINVLIFFSAAQKPLTANKTLNTIIKTPQLTKKKEESSSSEESDSEDDKPTVKAQKREFCAHLFRNILTL